MIHDLEVEKLYAFCKAREAKAVSARAKYFWREMVVMIGSYFIEE